MATLKALSKDEELAAVPGDQPVLVQLPGFDDDAPVADKTAKTPEPEDEGVNVLKQQLEELKRANAIAEERRIASERRAEQAERERTDALASKADTESDAVSSGLSAAQAEQESAKQALKTAGEAGDWNAIADAQARIGRSAADIREFERAIAALAEQKKTSEAAPQTTQPRQFSSVEAAIDAQPGLTDTERSWLKSHQDAWVDTGRNTELSAAYIKATRKGFVRGTPDYFKFIEGEMGYSQNQDDNMSVSAPVSRNERSGDGKPTGGKIMLTPEERDLAKSMGVTDIEYARQKVNFEAARKIEPAKYGDR